MISTNNIIQSLTQEKTQDKFQLDLKNIEIKEELNTGGTSTVFRATYNGIEVAVKDVKMDAEFTDFFQAEIEAFRILGDHPYIIKSYGYVDSNSKRYIVMDYMINGELNSYLQINKKTIKEPLMLKFSSDIAWGMKHAHDNKLVLIDLKCENILLDEYFNAKLCDLGFSLLKKNIENNKRFNGTAAFIAPELFQAEVKKEHIPYSEKSDVFSFGIVAYQIGTLRYPRYSKPGKELNTLETLQAIADNKRPKITKSCPKFMSRLTKKCWEQEPEKRPDADKIIQEIEARRLRLK